MWGVGDFDNHAIYLAVTKLTSPTSEIVSIYPTEPTFFEMTRQDRTISLGVQPASKDLAAQWDFSSIPMTMKDSTHILGATFIEKLDLSCFATGLNKLELQEAYDEDDVDDELMALAKKEGIDLTGYKHVIETSGTCHSQNRHGENSKDRVPLTVEDYFLIPYIIKNRDAVIISPSLTRIHKNRVFIYEKKIGNQYVYVEEIRRGRNKSLAFQSLRKRKAPE